MYISYIKKRLMSNDHRDVYSVIALLYSEKYRELKHSRFINWLAKEIDVPRENINVYSIRYNMEKHLRHLEACQKEMEPTILR